MMERFFMLSNRPKSYPKAGLPFRTVWLERNGLPKGVQSLFPAVELAVENPEACVGLRKVRYQLDQLRVLLDGFFAMTRLLERERKLIVRLNELGVKVNSGPEFRSCRRPISSCRKANPRGIMSASPLGA
jgi:hypothetical protein